MTNVVPFRRARYCASCAVPFVPLAPTHRLCIACFRWSRIAYHIAAVRAALDATGG